MDRDCYVGGSAPNVTNNKSVSEIRFDADVSLQDTKMITVNDTIGRLIRAGVFSTIMMLRSHGSVEALIPSRIPKLMVLMKLNKIFKSCHLFHFT